ncbi:receptor kinase-like protein Xa21 isoform X1 [Lactuca sativa]|uniref:receptor kinase-like protein Xa21 isoform X1 n=1 Tax=Lactuca sativa TaxID=4236 RepID=UPI000CD8B073|nr:receptor kinase-like protein Xa21 isoform X1 [Lactuca sativa]
MNSGQPTTSLSSSSCFAFIFSCFTIFLITVSGVGNNEADYQALLQFKSTIRNEEALSSWNSSFHFCDWSGVSCGKQNKKVTALWLESQGLEGSLSPYIGNLSFLRLFSIANNSFQGTIPHELGRLYRLRVLDLGHNKFNGVIPSNLSGCSKLERLGLNENKLVGSIPKEMSFLSKLTFIAVHDNKLTGGIPSVLGNISIESFSASDNPLGGSIPDTISHWKSLTEFYIGGCNLNGTIPHSIFNHSLLTHFSIASNHLTGSLPSALGAMLPRLVYLQLYGNKLTGPLPASLSNCSKLGFLEAQDNNFSGKLKIDFAKLKDMYWISIGGNNFGFGEADDMKFIDTLKNCSKLDVLDLSSSKLQGVLPASIGNLSDRLSYLFLDQNLIYGNLPPSIGNLAGLTILILANNRFTGKIPSTIGQLQKLQVAALFKNQFSGPIPDTIGNLSLLTNLRLNSNRLESHIPSSLGKCHHLLDVNLSDNKLSGRIPKQLLQLISLTIVLNLSQNNLSGSLPTEVGKLQMLTSLDLSYNNLSGKIPSSISGCISLIFLSLKGNLFQGTIPPSLSSLRGVSTLDLSHNNLSGQIPRFLERLILLEYVNLSYNDFEGDVPVVGVFANASAYSVLGNSRLCGGLAELGLPKCKETGKHQKRIPVFVIVLLIAFILFTVLCFLYAWCKKFKDQPSQSSVNGEQSKQVSYTYSQLFKATNGFSEANLIGEGGFSSIYKGILDDHDKYVAVKVIHLQNRGAHKSFIAECEAWRNIRHRNLLKIITSCSSLDFQGNDFKALVYEFMPNGSLHDWLHSSESKSRLNLLQRINILIDVASALDYLHNHCLPSIVHCDLKPSNILLDDDMVAHVGDFGLARFLGTNSDQNSTSGIRGTIGYAPPVAEYGVGSEMTSSGDVYSFGILLLEIMTGKRPTDNIFNEGLSLHKFAYLALPDHVTDVVDDDLLNFLQEHSDPKKCTSANAKIIEECVASIVKTGVSCSMDSPPQRMNIRIVAHQLHHVWDTLQNILPALHT